MRGRRQSSGDASRNQLQEDTTARWNVVVWSSIPTSPSIQVHAASRCSLRTHLFFCGGHRVSAAPSEDTCVAQKIHRFCLFERDVLRDRRVGFPRWVGCTAVFSRHNCNKYRRLKAFTFCDFLCGKKLRGGQTIQAQKRAAVPSEASRPWQPLASSGCVLRSSPALWWG